MTIMDKASNLLKTYIIESVKNGDLEKLQYLTAQGVNLLDTELPLIQIATINHRIETLAYLIKLGADVNQLDSDGRSPLGWSFLTPGFNASMQSVFTASYLLLDNGADPTKYPKFETSPLHYAALLNVNGIIKKLVLSGAELEATDTLQHTPLHIAVMYRSKKAAEVLVEEGANPLAINRFGKTPYDYLKPTERKVWFGNLTPLAKTSSPKPVNSPEPTIRKRNFFSSASMHGAVAKPDLPLANLPLASQIGLFRTPSLETVARLTTNIIRMVK